MSKKKKNTYTAVVQQSQRSQSNAKSAPAPKAESVPAPKRTGHRGLAIGAELVLGAVCIAVWWVLFTLRTCGWDVPLLVIWAVILIGAAILLLRGERRLAAARRNAGGM